MVVRGTFRKGVVVLDERVDLPDGQKVTVELKLVDNQGTSTTQKLLELAGTIKDGPKDASVNHDHYLYGTSKREADGL
jgi:predicted DNA-binding antitoxin AbrB/MazE fold protein